MRRVDFWTWVFENPLVMILGLLAVLAVVAAVIWQNVREANTAEIERNRERNRSDSIWKD